jgi:deazaflavin-dependent oxidoreductase (nitroreductase family)
MFNPSKASNASASAKDQTVAGRVIPGIANVVSFGPGGGSDLSEFCRCGRSPQEESMPEITLSPSNRKEFNRLLIEEFRANSGRVTGQFAERPLLLLTTTGAKSGRAYTTPVVYTKDGDRFVIIASKGGAPTNPDWYHNLVAHPTAMVELPNERFQAKAVVTAGAERERLFNRQAEQMPNFAEYQRKTTRQIPVIVLARI